MTIWNAIRPTPLGMRCIPRSNTLRIEAQLADAGVEHYMPAETRFTMHHRTKEWLEKRFALMPYVFVADIIDWPGLERDVRDMFGPVRLAHVPIQIPARDIARLRESELQINTGHALMHRNRQLTKRRLAELYPQGSKIEIGAGHMLAGQTATVMFATGRQTVAAMAEFLGGQVQVEIDVDQIKQAAE